MSRLTIAAVTAWALVAGLIAWVVHLPFGQVTYLWRPPGEWLVALLLIAAPLALAVLGVAVARWWRRGRTVWGRVNAVVAAVVGTAAIVGVTGLLGFGGLWDASSPRVRFDGSDGRAYLMEFNGSESTSLSVYRRTGLLTWTLVPDLDRVINPGWPCTGSGDASGVTIACSQGRVLRGR